MRTPTFSSISTLAVGACLSISSIQAASVVSFWGFAEDYDAGDGVNEIDFTPDVDNTAGAALLRAYLGNADELDGNGGGGIAYNSPTSGVSYAPTNSIKFDDLRGGGNDFSLGGVSMFQVDSGSGLETRDFGNDALIYLQLNLTNWQDVSVRFDVEGTPGPETLPTSFDVFYRTGGSGTWFREPDQNNIPITGYTTIDAENAQAAVGPLNLNAAVDGQEVVEIIISDFAETGNGEMELDNFELVGTQVPEPGSLALLVIGGVSLLRRRRG